MFMSNALERFCRIVEVKIPKLVLLSVRIVVGGWICPNSSKVLRMGTAVLALWKIPIVSASAAEDMTFLMVLHSVWSGPFCVGFGVAVLLGSLSLR